MIAVGHCDTFYDLHSHCIEEIEPEFNSEKLNYSGKINSLLYIDIDIKAFLKTSKFGKRVTFDYLKTRQGAKAYSIINNLNSNKFKKFNILIIDKVTEAVKSQLDQWITQITSLKQNNEFDKFSIKENELLYASTNIMLNRLSFFQSYEQEYLLNSRHKNNVEEDYLLHRTVKVMICSA
nr:hypothetical protein [uncultured Tolumonas sp.]